MNETKCGGNETTMQTLEDTIEPVLENNPELDKLVSDYIRKHLGELCNEVVNNKKWNIKLRCCKIWYVANFVKIKYYVW